MLATSGYYQPACRTSTISLWNSATMIRGRALQKEVRMKHPQPGSRQTRTTPMFAQNVPLKNRRQRQRPSNPTPVVSSTSRNSVLILPKAPLLLRTSRRSSPVSGNSESGLATSRTKRCCICTRPLPHKAVSGKSSRLKQVSVFCPLYLQARKLIGTIQKGMNPRSLLRTNRSRYSASIRISHPITTSRRRHGSYVRDSLRRASQLLASLPAHTVAVATWRSSAVGTCILMTRSPQHMPPWTTQASQVLRPPVHSTTLG